VVNLIYSSLVQMACGCAGLLIPRPPLRSNPAIPVMLLMQVHVGFLLGHVIHVLHIYQNGYEGLSVTMGGL
jgi:hypothetical protein